MTHPEILRKYQEKGWIKEIIEEKATDYRQKVWVDRMVWRAKTVYKADWVINASFFTSSVMHTTGFFTLHKEKGISAIAQATFFKSNNRFIKLWFFN